MDEVKCVYSNKSLWICVLSDEVHSKVPDDGANAPVDKKDDPTLIGTEEICHILDNKGIFPWQIVHTL